MVDFIQLLFFILPAYLANSTPVLLGGGAAIDLGRSWSDGRCILGPGKTIRGFISGVAAGIFGGAVLALYVPLPFFASSTLPPFVSSFQFPVSTLHLLASTSLAFGTMLGDSLGSFLKRRINIPPGTPFWPDTVLFLAVALLLAYPFTSSEMYQPVPLAFLFLLTAVLHPLSNMLANKMGWKKVPW